MPRTQVLGILAKALEQGRGQGLGWAALRVSGTEAQREPWGSGQEDRARLVWVGRAASDPRWLRGGGERPPKLLGEP